MPQRVFLTPILATRYLAFNTRRPLFADTGLRQAVNYALDRSAIAATFGYLPADHDLPPGMPGFQDAHVYPTNGPDLKRARALTHGHSGRAVLYVCNLPLCAQWAHIIHRNLAAIGIDVAVEKYADPVAQAKVKGARVDMLLTTTSDSFPPSAADPVTFLENVLGGSGSPPGWSSANPLKTKLRPITSLRGKQREAAAGALDLQLARTAPAAALATETFPEFFSARVGCQIFQPVYVGVDIATLCLHRGR